MTNECLSKMGGFKVVHLTGEKDGNPYDFFKVSKSWKDQNNEWKEQQISVRAPDIIVLAELLATAAGKVVAEQAKRANEASQSRGDAGGSYEVPF